MSGGALTSCSDESNPCRKAYIDYCGHGVNRPSWDPLTLIAAVRGAEGVRSVYHLITHPRLLPKKNCLCIPRLKKKKMNRKLPASPLVEFLKSFPSYLTYANVYCLVVPRLARTA